MNDLSESRDIIIFIISGHGINQFIFDKDISIIFLRRVRISKVKNLDAAGGLTRRKIIK
jgi:hypothetical protein